MSNITSDAAQNIASQYMSPFAQSGAAAKQPAKEMANPALFAEIMDDLDEGFQAAQPQPEIQVASSGDKASADFTFLDFIDIINPLQHIPVVSNIYRAVTGDEIRQEVRIAGNIMFGAISGPIGIATGVGSAAVDYASGKPVGDHVLAAVAPNLEQTIREDYSIAHYLYNPFSEDPASAKIAAAPVAVNVGQAAQNLGRGQESQAIYAQTAQMLDQKLRTPKAIDDAPSTPIALNKETTSANFAPLNPPVAPIAQLPQSLPIGDLPTKNVVGLAADQAKEMQSMARSVTSSHSNVVNLSPEAAEQLSLLAGATANPAVALFNGDTTSQLQAITAKNRQLGIALNSSAAISQQMSDAQAEQINFQIGNKVAALYKNNSAVVPHASNVDESIASLNAAVPQLQPQPVALQAKPEPNIETLINRAYFNDQDRAHADPRPKSGPPARPVLAETQQPMQPNQLGQSYHGAGSNNPTNLSIAAAMQQALDKYQSLRK